MELGLKQPDSTVIDKLHIATSILLIAGDPLGTKEIPLQDTYTFICTSFAFFLQPPLCLSFYP